MFSSSNDLVSHEFVLRDAKKEDIEDICRLGALLNTINLPAQKDQLENVIDVSENSFSRTLKDRAKRAFLFVLIHQNQKVIGTSQIFSKHGTLEHPNIYFEVSPDERYSHTLKKYFRHRILRLSQNFDGPSEVGSLVLLKNFRSIPQKLGRNLSFVRFLFVAMNPHFFSNQIIAELLPPLGPNFESTLWEAIGRHYTGLDYYEADIISRQNKEFIKSLFPSGAIHVSLLPKEAQDVIGQVGRNSRGAAHLLTNIGFRYNHHVDPFDGGPHYEAKQEDITIIKNCIHGVVKSQEDHAPNNLQSPIRVGLVGRYRPEEKSGNRFRATLAAYTICDEKIISLHKNTLKALDMNDGEEASVIDLTHKE